MSALRSLVSCAGLVLWFATSVAAEPVVIDIGTANVIDGSAILVARLRANGNVVGGVQNDILFDTRIVNLPSRFSCSVGPEIDGSAPGCGSGPSSEPCFTLVRDLVNCGESPFAQGCEDQPAHISRLRAFVLSYNSLFVDIPDGAELYRCVFDVREPDQLPAWLKIDTVFASDVYGERLEVIAPNAYIGAGPDTPPTWTPAPTPTPAPAGSLCLYDRHCESADCSLSGSDRLGTCSDSRTPVPVSSECVMDDQCAEGLHCNNEEGVCCRQRVCPDGLSCRVPGREGECVTPPTPTATPSPSSSALVHYETKWTKESGSMTLTATLVEGDRVYSFSNDLFFDHHLLQPAGGVSCYINPTIGRAHPECRTDPISHPCKIFAHRLRECGGDCPEGMESGSRFRIQIHSVDQPDAGRIPPGTELFTCAFEVVDTSLAVLEVAVAPEAFTLSGEQIEIQVTSSNEPDGLSILPVRAPGNAASPGDLDERHATDGCAMQLRASFGAWWLLAIAALLQCARLCRERRPASSRLS